MARQCWKAPPDRHGRNESRPMADVFPAYGRLLPRGDGEIWVEEFERPGHTGGSRWMVFDATGVSTARVTTPASFTPMQVGADYVLGVFRDEVDVEHIRMYGLSRRV